jgi:hypothetical protein
MSHYPLYFWKYLKITLAQYDLSIQQCINFWFDSTITSVKSVYHKNTFLQSHPNKEFDSCNKVIHKLCKLCSHKTKRLGYFHAVDMITPAYHHSASCSGHIFQVSHWTLHHTGFPWKDASLNLHLLFWMFPIKHVNFTHQRLQEIIGLVHPCMHHASLPAASHAQNIIIYHQMKKK